MSFLFCAPNSDKDVLTGVTMVVRKQYALCYEDGSTYSGESDTDELVVCIDGKYAMYLQSNSSEKMWIKNEDEMLEPKYDADVEPVIEKVLVINFYDDGESGGIKYRLILPSEKCLSK